MDEVKKKYDLEDRTLRFGQAVRRFIKQIPNTVSNLQDCKQLARSSGSIGANYIEANENLGTKDFRMHIKISRKEAKESRFFLRLVDIDDKEGLEKEKNVLIQEATELMLIFGSILRKSETPKETV